MKTKALLVKHVWFYDFRCLYKSEDANATWIGGLTGEILFTLKNVNYSFIYWDTYFLLLGSNGTSLYQKSGFWKWLSKTPLIPSLLEEWILTRAGAIPLVSVKARNWIFVAPLCKVSHITLLRKCCIITRLVTSVLLTLPLPHLHVYFVVCDQ